MFRVPQVLYYFDAIRYSEELRNKLSGGDKLMQSGDEMEVEIRGVSIRAVDLIQKAIQADFERRGINREVNSILIDFYLWDYRRQNVEAIDNAIDFHRVRSVYY